MTSEVLRIRARADATPALLDQLKDEGGCAGTWHKFVGAENTTYELPCLGNKMCLTAFTQTETEVDPNSEEANLVREVIHASQTRKAAERAGIPYEEIKKQEILFTETQQTYCTPKAVTSCPCARASKLSEFQQAMREHLGVSGDWPLRIEQKMAKEYFAEGKNLYIYGSPDTGKTYIATLIAESFHRRVNFYTGEEIGTYFTRMALNSEDVSFTGLLFLDDADKNNPSPNFVRKLWMCLNKAKNSKLRMIITANIPMAAFVNKYAVNEDEKGSTENRLSRFEEIHLV